MNTSKSLDEIIRLLAVWETQAYIKREPDTPMLSRREAKQAIVEAVEGLAGPDEKGEMVSIPCPDLKDGCLVSHQDFKMTYRIKHRNELRAEIRQAIKEWQ